MAFEIRIAIEILLLLSLVLVAVWMYHISKHMIETRHKPHELPTVDEEAFDELLQQHERLKQYQRTQHENKD